MDEIIQQIVIGAVGDGSGGLAASMILALSGRIRRRFQPESKQQALCQALEKALIAAFGSLPSSTSRLTAYYLDRFSSFLRQTVVQEELATLLDPHDAFDIRLLRKEFMNLTFVDESQGQVIPDLDFEGFICTLSETFYAAVKDSRELREIIVVERLDKLVESLTHTIQIERAIAQHALQTAQNTQQTNWLLNEILQELRQNRTTANLIDTGVASEYVHQSNHSEDLVLRHLEIQSELIRRFKAQLAGVHRSVVEGEGYKTEEQLNLFKKICDELGYAIIEHLSNYFHSRGLDNVNISLAISLILPGNLLSKILFGMDVKISKTSDGNEVHDKEILQDKLLKENWVVTVWRDKTTRQSQNRALSSKVYAVKGNTIFKALLDQDMSIYISNAVDELATIGAYETEESDWRQFYNSIIAVPIRDIELQADDSYQMSAYGILSADTLTGYRTVFDQTCYYVLSYASDLLAIFIRQLTLPQISSKSSG